MRQLYLGKFTRLALALLIAGLLGAPPLFAPSGASANDSSCPFHGPNWTQSHGFSTACLTYPYGGYGAASMRDPFNNGPMSVDSSLVNLSDRGHVNQAIWAFSGDPCVSWVETGLTVPMYDSSQGLINGYYRYAAYQDSTLYRATQLGTEPQDGSYHWYEVYWANPGQSYPEYQVWYDNTNLIYDYTSQFQGIGLGYGECNGLAGVEISPNIQPDWRYYSSTFNHYSLEFWIFATGGYAQGWYYWYQGLQWVDYPCGTYSPPDCFNGAYYTPSEPWYWSNNTGR